MNSNPVENRKTRDAKWRHSAVTWRIARRTLIALVGVVTLVAAFYTVENSRGQRAWERCKRALESKGFEMNWSTHIPAPVPDEENIFKAPKMQEWFVGRGRSEVTRCMNDAFTRRAIVVEIIVQHASRLQGTTNAALTLDYNPQLGGISEPDRQQLYAVIKQTLDARTNTSPALPIAFAPGRKFIAREAAEPARVAIRATTPLSPNQVRSTLLLAKELDLAVESTSNATFAVVQNNSSTVDAAAFITQTDACRPELDMITEALRRPYARMDGDYTQPHAVPIPNFIAVRSVAQLLTDRSRCYLLLGQPDNAVRELELLGNLPKLMQGKPVTLVAAMIEVAVSGLHAQTVADGFRINAWREPQLVALEQQLEDVNLFPTVIAALRIEPVAVCQGMEMTPTRELVKWFGEFDAAEHPFRFWVMQFMPRGWVFQNMRAIATHRLDLLPELNPTTGSIRPREFDKTADRTGLSPNSPYTFLAAVATPNWSRAWQTTARNQTIAQQARIACALERHRLNRGDYPESLDSLVPQFLGSIPYDVIGGQPLKFRLTPDGRFLLYSLGWNDSDDGGLVRTNSTGGIELTEGDWVWPPPN